MQTLDLKVEEALKEFVRRNRRLGLVGYSSHLKDGKVVIYVSSAEKVSKLTLPRALSGLDIEFQVVGLMKALEGPRGGDEDRTGYFDPLPAGVSIGHYKITAGTAGWFAVRDDKTLIISNNHVLAWENKGQVGDPILQPGPLRPKPARLGCERPEVHCRPPPLVRPSQLRGVHLPIPQLRV